MTDLAWIKASRSHGNGNCVEVAPAEGGVMVRDSKQNGMGVSQPVLFFTADEWSAFLDGASKGEFGAADQPAERDTQWGVRWPDGVETFRFLHQAEEIAGSHMGEHVVVKRTVSYGPWREVSQ